MNLWVRRSGLILLSALTFFSCEEELSTVGLPPENDLGIFFVDVPLNDKVSQVWVDNIYSRGTGSMLVGSYEDEYFGHIEARSFTELTLPAENPGKNFSGTATLDSLVIETRIRGIYGSNVKNTLNKIEVYQLTDTIPVKDQAYTIASSQALGSKLAEGEFYIYPDSLGLKFSDTGRDKDMDALDSAYWEKFFDSNGEYIYKNSYRINDAFALDFFSKIKNQDQAFANDTTFDAYFKGLAFVPSTGNSAILTYGVPDTRMVLYYSETDSQGNTTQEALVMGLSQTIYYNNIQPNKNIGWSGSHFDDLTEFYDPYITNTDLAYVQSGTNLLMKIDLSSIQQFADTVDSPVIQKAELVLSNVVDAGGNTPPPANMVYYLTSMDSLMNENYRVGTISNNARTAVQQVAYNSEDNEIRNDITIALQGLLYEENFNQLILAPVRLANNTFLPTASSVNRLVVNKDNMHLRFYYSIPEKN
ncbi:DUF4270 family protein [Fulvivirga kasyanovii]|uniref:DUF4270 family protein n=1 Tax=Fulvivirga kasyanovii TaxID=396812 RepID=A0ABW9RXP8_9BACT|nr:DUF4270 family protein [Fulvivirga kasyanovii]MTI28540.1 DUF4270 family protein [Fulvivirga kasyanovii]